MLATQLCHRQTCLALFQYCHDLAFGKPAFLQGSLHIREAPKFYRLTSTHRGSLRRQVRAINEVLQMLEKAGMPQYLVPKCSVFFENILARLPSAAGVEL